MLMKSKKYFHGHVIYSSCWYGHVIEYFQTLKYDVVSRTVEPCYINITVDPRYDKRLKTTELFDIPEFKNPPARTVSNFEVDHSDIIQAGSLQ